MDIAQIIAKKRKGTLPHKEQEYLDLWLNESEENKALFHRLRESGIDGDLSVLANLESDAQWRQVLEKSKKDTSRDNKTFWFRSLLKYAAIFIGIMGVGYGYWQFNLYDKDAAETKDVITLELDNGELRTISPGNPQTITNTEGTVLGKQKGDQLIYSNASETEKLVYNTLTVPYGRRFSLVLSDSTIVHLNAGSSLKYPVKFIENENRQVFLTGEGYFDVTKNMEHPFVVTSGSMDVRVLGTKFNISAYPEDREINTVLVEGSVSLYDSKSEYDPEKASRLEPGYKAAWDRFYQKIDLEQVDTDIYTGWIDGKLVIKEMAFKNIIQKLQRHYKVSIQNEFLRLDNEIFTATFDTETVEEALKIFSMETPFEFEVKNETITIYEPKTTH